MALPLLAAASLAPIFSFAIKFFIGTLIMRIVLSLGITIVTFTQADNIASWIGDYMLSGLTGFSAQAASAVSAIGLVNAFNIIVSAYVAAIGIKQLKNVYNRLTFGGN